MFTDTITIYNHYIEQGTDKWKRTVIHRAMWTGSSVKTITNGILSVVDTVNITILADNLPCKYVGEKEWKNLVDKTGYFTLGTGNLDVIALGEYDEVENISAFKKKHDDVVTIKSVKNNSLRSRLKSHKVVCV